MYAFQKNAWRAAQAVILHICARKTNAYPDIIRKTGSAANVTKAAQHVPVRRHIAPAATPGTIPKTENV